MMTNIRSYAGAAIALMGLSLSANAALLVSYDETATRPADEKILSTLNPDNVAEGAAFGSYTWRRNNSNNSNNWNRAISFQATASGTLDELGVYLVDAGGGGGGYTATITIREFDSPPTNPRPAANPGLLAIDVEIDVSGSTANGILKFSFSDEDVITLTEGKWYTVSFVWDSDQTYNSAMNFYFRDVNSGLDSEGNTISVGSWRWNPTGSNVAQASNNVLFYAATSQAIPEPSTYALLGLAAVGATFYRRGKMVR